MLDKRLYKIHLGLDEFAHFSLGLGINEYFADKKEKIKTDYKSKIEAGIMSVLPDADGLGLLLSDDFIQETIPLYSKLTGGHRGHLHSLPFAAMLGLYTKAKYDSFEYGFSLGLSHMLIDLGSGGSVEVFPPDFEVQLYPSPENSAHPNEAIAIDMIYHTIIGAGALGYCLYKSRKRKKLKHEFENDLESIKKEVENNK